MNVCINYPPEYEISNWNRLIISNLIGDSLGDVFRQKLIVYASDCLDNCRPSLNRECLYIRHDLHYLDGINLDRLAQDESDMFLSKISCYLGVNVLEVVPNSKGLVQHPSKCIVKFSLRRLLASTIAIFK